MTSDDIGTIEAAVEQLALDERTGLANRLRKVLLKAEVERQAHLSFIQSVC